MNEWLFALGGVAAGLGFGYAYGLRESDKIFANLNHRAMHELDKSIATISGLREQVDILKSSRCCAPDQTGDALANDR